jgi:hypothetical protein
LGKEFLLFQVLRDDYISLIVRSCWLVSFFFTPIYMLILVFLVMFDVKKGSIVTYKSSWHTNFNSNMYSMYYILRNFILNPQKVTYFISYRYLFTSVTSRSTSYFLLTFWLFFFFFGESLLLIVFNFSTTIDTITSSSFFTIKQHVIFFLNSTSYKLTYHINFYIFFLTSTALMYLINLSYSYNYNYFILQSKLINLVFIGVILFYVLV